MTKKESETKRLSKRDWIQKGEGQLSYVQFFGFILIVSGVIFFSCFLLPSGIKNIWFFKSFGLGGTPEPNEISIAFFTTMLGVSFAFPEMLKDNSNEMSTMRITVFMLTNVICMLLLKIGWGAKSLTEIGLDGSWVGVIAFLFGAKAAQSYFENADKIRMNSTNPSGAKSSSETPNNGNNGDLNISQIAIAQLAKVQNENNLRSRFSNIVSVSDSLLDEKSCLTLYIEDSNKNDIPAFVDAALNEETLIKVPTRIISNSGAADPHISQRKDEVQDSLADSGFGSFCCLAQNEMGTIGMVTVGHNFTKSTFKNLGGTQFGKQKRNVLLNGDVIGKLLYQRMDYTQDLAIVEITNKTNLFDGYTSFNNNYYVVTHKDILTTPNAIIESRPNKDRKGPNVRSAYILDCNINYDVMYNGKKYPMVNVILLADSSNPDTCKQVSLPGDSGSCVYHANNQLIGILIGGNGKFSIVLPIKNIMEQNNFKIL